MFRKGGIFLLMFLLAFLVRLISVFNYNLPLGGDEISYNGLATSIVSKGSYYLSGSYAMRPPAYPFFISIIYFLFGKNLMAVRITQALIDSLLCVLIYKLCSKLFNRSVALVAFFTSVFYLLFIKGVSRFLTETLFTFILFCVVFYIYKTKERFTYVNMSILGIGIAVLALTKGLTLLFLPFLFLVLLILHYYHPIGLKEIAKKMLVGFIVFLIPISIWTYRNYRIYHAFIPICTQSPYVFYSSYFPRDGKVFGVDIIDDNVRFAMSLKSEGKLSRYLIATTLGFIKQHPFKTLRLELLKIFYFWVPFDWEIMGVEKGIYQFQYMFILPFSVFGMFLLRRKYLQYIPLCAPIAYFFFMSLIFYGSPRFRMPIEPYLIIFFSIGIIRFFEMFKNKYIPALISISYALVNCTMYFNSDLIKYLFRGIAKSMGLW